VKVKDAMMGTPYSISFTPNLGSAAELMWVGNCGFLLVMGANENPTTDASPQPEARVERLGTARNPN
jgi:hypothetical protein